MLTVPVEGRQTLAFPASRENSLQRMFDFCYGGTLTQMTVKLLGPPLVLKLDLYTKEKPLNTKLTPLTSER